jgi:WS/DGAT/MGAT family acyltransferase
MARRLSDLDALLWELEVHDPSLRSVITVVVVLDLEPDPSAVAARLDRMSRRIPPLRDRMTNGPLAIAPPQWEPDPEFDLAHHLVDAGALAGPDGALRLAETLASTSLPPGRPPWQIHLGRLDGGTGTDRAALVIRLHHTFTDGVGAMQLAGELFDVERHPSEPPVPPVSMSAPSPPALRLPRLGGLLDDLVFETRRGFGVARAVIPWAAGMVRDAAVDPEPRVRQTAELLRDGQLIRRAATSGGSAILAPRSARSSFAAIDLPLADMRVTAAGAGGTINDVFLAGILGGLRLYHAKHGAHPASLRIGIPVNTRDDGGSDLRNQFVPLVVRAPLQLVDAPERVQLLHLLVLAARQWPALAGFEWATGMLRRLPGGLTVAAGLLRSADLMASNVPGSPIELYLAGAQVRRIIPFGPRGGTGLNLTLLSHHETVHIGVNSDAAALPDQDVLVDCLQRGFEETLG